MSNSSIWPLDRTLSGATTMGGPGGNGNEGVIYISQSSSITGTSPSDCLVSYPGHSLGKVLPLRRNAVGILYSPSWLGNPRITATLETVIYLICPMSQMLYIRFIHEWNIKTMWISWMISVTFLCTKKIC